MEAAIKPDTTDLPMMIGTDGHKNYVAFAKNGPFALGVKAQSIRDGSFVQMPGHTWFIYRLRSAASAGLFPAADETVVDFKKVPETHEEAWPGITWEKNGPARASTTISLLMKGSPSTAEGIHELANAIGNGALSDKVVDYLKQLAGGHFVIDEAKAKAFFESLTVAFIDALQAKLIADSTLKSEMSNNVGKMGLHADVLKKCYEATKEKHSKPAYGELALAKEKAVEEDEDDDLDAFDDFDDDNLDEIDEIAADKPENYDESDKPSDVS